MFEDRYALYRDRCRAEGRPDIIAPDGVYRVGDFTFGADGVLYVSGEAYGPYMIAKRYHESTIVVRVKETLNAHRFEALRWRLLLRIQVLSARLGRLHRKLKKLAKERGGRVIGPHHRGDGWRRLTFRSDGDGAYSIDHYTVHQDNILDTMSSVGTEHRTVTEFLRTQDTIKEYRTRVARMESALLWIFREMDPEGETRRAQHTSIVRYKVNGRDYVSFTGSASNRSDCRTAWPNPGQLFVDLDEARYGPQVVVGDQ